MRKPIWQSKTLWGFGLAGLIALAQILGVEVAQGTVGQAAEVLTALFGAYGLRDAVDKK